MAGKKDFSKVKTDKAETGVNTGKVYSDIERGESTYMRQGTASKEEQTDRANQLKTQGRKGCKAVRINMAITPENHKFIKTMSMITGQTMTEFTNYIVKQYRLEHPDIYEQAQKVLEQIQGNESDKEK